jgi:hypothetical protein
LKTGECIPLFLLVKAFLGFTQNSFEKRHAATCRFQKGFVKSREIFQPIGRKGSKFKREWCMHRSFQKSFENSKASGLKGRGHDFRTG